MLRLSKLLVLAGLVLPAAWPQQSYSFFSPSPAPPLLVTATANSPFGQSSYCYWVVVVYPIGKSTPSVPSCVPNAIETSSVLISWSAAQGASSYDVLRTTTPILPNVTSNIAVATAVSGTTQTDSFGALSSYTVSSAVSATANLYLDNTAYSTPQLRAVVTGVGGTTAFNLGSGTVPFVSLTCGASDISTAIQNALNSNASTGAWILISPGSCTGANQIVIPAYTTGQPINNQQSFRISCIAGGQTWINTTMAEGYPNSPTACQLNLTYEGNNGGKIEDRFAGALEIDNIYFTDTSTPNRYSSSNTLTNIAVSGGSATATFSSAPNGLYRGSSWKVSGSATASLNSSPYLITATSGNTITFSVQVQRLAHWNGTTTALTMVSCDGVVAGMTVSGTNIAANTTVSSTSGCNGPWGTVNLNQNTTAGSSPIIEPLVFAVPNGTYTDATMEFTPPFIHTTNATLNIHDNNFVGNSSAVQDAIVFGGPTTSFSSATIDAPFQGYNAMVRRNGFRNLGRGIFGMYYTNDIYVEDNSWMAFSAAGTRAVESYGNPGQCTVGTGGGGCNFAWKFKGNIFEVDQGYVYTIVLTNTWNAHFEDSFWDLGSQFLFPFSLTNSLNNTVDVISQNGAPCEPYLLTGSDLASVASTRLLGGCAGQYDPLQNNSPGVFGQIRPSVVRGDWNGNEGTNRAQLYISGTSDPYYSFNIGIDTTNGIGVIDINHALGATELDINSKGGQVNVGSRLGIKTPGGVTTVTGTGCACTGVCNDGSGLIALSAGAATCTVNFAVNATHPVCVATGSTTSINPVGAASATNYPIAVSAASGSVNYVCVDAIR